MSFLHAIYLLAASNSLPSFEYVPFPAGKPSVVIAEKFPRLIQSTELVRASLKDRSPGYLFPSGFASAMVTSRSSQNVSGGFVLPGDRLHGAHFGDINNMLIARGHRIGDDIRPSVWTRVPTETQPSAATILEIPTSSNRGSVLDIQSGKAVGIVGKYVPIPAGTVVDEGVLDSGIMVFKLGPTRAIGSIDAEIKPVVWDVTTRAVTILPSVQGQQATYASGVNAQGEVVGWSDKRKSKSVAVLWKNGELHRLEDLVTGLPPQIKMGMGIAINDQGDILIGGHLGNLITSGYLKRLP
jgi:probable HAF family extracellular repeat protein